LIPVTVRLVIASGTVMARVADSGWVSVSVTIDAVVLMISVQVNPLWILFVGGAWGGLGFH
jgi:chromate transporter